MHMGQLSLHSLEFAVEFEVDNNAKNNRSQNGHGDNSGQCCPFSLLIRYSMGNFRPYRLDKS